MIPKLYFFKGILTSKVQQIYFSENLVCWSDTGLLDLFVKTFVSEHQFLVKIDSLKLWSENSQKLNT